MKRASCDAEEAFSKRQRRETNDLGPQMSRVRNAVARMEALPQDVRRLAQPNPNWFVLHYPDSGMPKKSCWPMPPTSNSASTTR